MRILSKPIGRESMAWALACVVCSILLSAFVLLGEAGDTQWPILGLHYRLIDGRLVAVKTPMPEGGFKRKITIWTNEDHVQIMSAVAALDLPEVRMRSISTTSDWARSDYGTTVLGAVFLVVIGSWFFRFVEKLGLKIFRDVPPELSP